MLNKNGRKKAEVTLEVVMTVALSLLVLFFVLSLFGDNLNKMLQNSGLQKRMAVENTKKTAYETFNKNPTKTQVNVQIVADQANLAWYHDQAQQQIEKKAAITTPLTDQQKIDLAKYLTIFSQSGPQGVDPNTVLDEKFELSVNKGINSGENDYPYTQIRKVSYNQVKNDNLITIDYDARETTIPLASRRIKTVKWNKNKKYDLDTDYSSEEAPRIKNVLELKNVF